MSVSMKKVARKRWLRTPRRVPFPQLSWILSFVVRDVVIVEDGTPAADLHTAQPGQLRLNVQGLHFYFHLVATMRLIKHLQPRGSR